MQYAGVPLKRCFLPLTILLASAALLATTALLAACASPAPKPALTQPAQDTGLPTTTPAPTRTPLPTRTQRPSLTPTVTLTQPPAATLTATPDPALAEIDLTGMAWYENYDMLLSFQFPGPVEPEDYRVTLEDKEFKCETIAAYPNRLICRGPGAKVLAVAVVKVYPAGSTQPGFEKEMWIPYFDNNYNSFNQ
jgi:hypothetical protein